MKKILFILFMLFVLTGCETTETIKPQLLAGDDHLNIGEQHTDSGCIVVIDGETHVMDIKSNNINSTEIGIYTITYELTVGEISFNCERNVVVSDTEAPYVRLEPGVDTVYVGDTHIDGGILATDNHTEELDIETISNVDTSTAGTYQIKYIVKDESLNTTVITRTVTVLEVE